MGLSASSVPATPTGDLIAILGLLAILVFVLAFGLLCAVLVWFFILETPPVQRRRVENPFGILCTWRALMADPCFIIPALVGGLAQADIFAFITGSPFVYVNRCGEPLSASRVRFKLAAYKRRRLKPCRRCKRNTQHRTEFLTVPQLLQGYWI